MFGNQSGVPKNQELFWERSARNLFFAGFGVGVVAAMVKYMTENGEAVRTLMVISVLLIIACIIANRFHCRSFVRARIEEGMTKEQARAEFYKQFPVSRS